MRVEANGLSFNVVVDGPEDGRPVVLLHGWPDSSRLWRHQIPALTAAGFRVVAPDLRGFGESDRPEGKEHYGMRLPAGDVSEIMNHLGIERAAIVGHDWGAGLGWMLATVYAPERVERMAVLSVGHPAAVRGAGLRQRQLSWYMLLFQFEGVAEQFLSMHDWAGLRAFEHPDVEQAVADLSRPGALTASLNWYRANLPPESWLAPPLALPAVRCPTLGIWSTGDVALTEEQMLGSSQYVAGPWRYERIEGASHWMQLDEPERVSALLLDFLGA